jgi:hypothetical protein
MTSLATNSLRISHTCEPPPNNDGSSTCDRALGSPRAAGGSATPRTDPTRSRLRKPLAAAARFSNPGGDVSNGGVCRYRRADGALVWCVGSDEVYDSPTVMNGVLLVHVVAHSLFARSLRAEDRLTPRTRRL